MSFFALKRLWVTAAMLVLLVLPVTALAAYL